MRTTLCFSAGAFLAGVGIASAFVTPTLVAHGTTSSCWSPLASSAATVEFATVDDAKQVLSNAVATKSEDSDTIVAALLTLESSMRQTNKEQEGQAAETLEALAGNGGGSWQLVFTTGTIDMQKKTGRINYFPIKAVQSFTTATDPWYIENGIYIGDFCLIKFKGDFDWTLQKSGVSKLTFDFTSIKILNAFEIQLKAGEAASLGAKTGLGSENNVELEKRGKRPFFNWISADSKIATARGGGGGLALWKRIDYEGEQ